MFYQMEDVTLFFKKRYHLGIKPGLFRMNQLLTYLNHPERQLRAVHVAGTNGKGSTIHFLKNALMDSGYKVGLFTSPSMSGLTGHIMVDHTPIAPQTFIKMLNEMLPVIQKMDEEGNHATEFEIVTALSLMYFARHVDLALIETGMGGREDTTNCVKPLLSIITTVDFDHTAYLGDTLEKIASHKAGIIKDNIPVILGEMQSRVLPIFEKEAKEKQAPVYRLTNDFTYDRLQTSAQGQSFIWRDNQKSVEVQLMMQGFHQVENSSLALKALILLDERGLAIHWDKALAGIKRTQVAGRFELIRRQPAIILDGAHNPAAMQTFLDTVESLYAGREKHLIFGAFKDKAIAEMMTQCMSHFNSITLTSFDHPRAADQAIWERYAACEKVNIASDWKHCVSSLLNKKEFDHALYFITGSLNFVTQVRHYIKNNNKIF